MTAKESAEPTTPNEDVAASVPPLGQGVGDRVAMLSLRSDGTPDQVNPTLIGAGALEGTTRQFTEQAVSAVDELARRESAQPVQEPIEQDPSIAELKSKHDAAAAAAQQRAVEITAELAQR
ncbi:MAG: hypothetical protein KBF43_08990 [Dermatophilaceae bacterium]|nr:hypothetical protein [Dermatophilaceae bacterium]